MALTWVLAVLSLLPLVGAQSPECVNITGSPITNATLNQLSGKWYYIAAAFRQPEFHQWANMVHTAFMYFTPNQTEDKVYFQEYMTFVKGDRCEYNASLLTVQRENGTMTINTEGVEYVAYVIHSKDPGIFLFAYYPEDKENVGVSIYANTTEVTPEQMNEFHRALECLGMDKSEVRGTDHTKDACGPMEKQHEEEKKKKKNEETAEAQS